MFVPWSSTFVSQFLKRFFGQIERAPMDRNEMPGLRGAVYALTLFTPDEQGSRQMLYAGTTDGVWARYVTSSHISYFPLVYRGYP